MTQEGRGGRRQRALQAGVLALVFCVGLLVGRRWAPVPEPPPPCPEPVCACPVVELAAAKPRPPRPRPPSARSLPPEPAPTPQQRAALLAWVEKHSVRLSPCVPRAVHPLVATVTLQVDGGGQVVEVAINSDQGLDRAAARCLRQGIGEWTLPRELSGKEQRLMFGLRL